MADEVDGTRKSRARARARAGLRPDRRRRHLRRRLIAAEYTIDFIISFFCLLNFPCHIPGGGVRRGKAGRLHSARLDVGLTLTRIGAAATRVLSGADEATHTHTRTAKSCWRFFEAGVGWCRLVWGFVDGDYSI